jgi:hypothetical protein
MGPPDEMLIDQIPPTRGVAGFHKLAADLPFGVLHWYILPRQRVGGQDKPPEQRARAVGTLGDANETDVAERSGLGNICHL